MAIGVVVACLVLVLAVLVAIFYLTRQDTKRTGDVALVVERWLLTIVPPTGTGEIGEPTWAGLTIRKLAHIAEYAVLGLVVSLASLAFLGRATVATWGLSIALCAAVSVCDQVAKNFVPGRHFDAADLPLDALGYVVAITLTNVAWALIVR